MDDDGTVVDDDVVEDEDGDDDAHVHVHGMEDGCHMGYVREEDDNVQWMVGE